MAERPEPIRTDGSNDFARHSMAIRVPGIILEVLERNPDYSPAIRTELQLLHDHIVGDTRITLFEPPAPDYELWDRLLGHHSEATWLNTEWFFCEMYSYRLIVQAARYWSTLRDPFGPMKEEELQSEALGIVLGETLEMSGPVEELLNARLTGALWGNRIDLSLKHVAQKGTAAHHEHLLADNIPEVIDYLLSSPAGDIHIIMDNAGTEQILDFVLVDLLLQEHLARRITLHVKMMPVLVSDVILADVPQALAYMQKRKGEVADLALRIQSYIEVGRLDVVPDFFWNTAGRYRELPFGIRKSFAGARMVIGKGDVNYRRAANDAIWPAEATLAEAIPDFPAPLLLLRTLKSDTLVGVDPELQTRLDREEGYRWRNNGTYGVAQFFRPETPGVQEN